MSAVTIQRSPNSLETHGASTELDTLTVSVLQYLFKLCYFTFVTPWLTAQLFRLVFNSKLQSKIFL